MCDKDGQQRYKTSIESKDYVNRTGVAPDPEFPTCPTCHGLNVINRLFDSKLVALFL